MRARAILRDLLHSSAFECVCVLCNLYGTYVPL